MMFSDVTDLSKRADAGLVAPIDSLIEEEKLNIEEEYSNSSYPKIDDSYYGLPGKMVTMLVLLNKDHLDEAGLPVPTDWTWEDYKEYAEKLTKTEGNTKRYGSYFHTWPDVYFILKLLGKQENSSIVNSDGTSNMEDPMLEETLKLRYDMEQVDKSSVPLSETLSQKLDYRQQFFSESASMIPSGSWMVSEWGAFTPDFTMAWAPWPKNNEEGPSYTEIGGDIFSIANNSEHKEEAYTFIRWMTTEGMILQETWIPTWNNSDLNEVLDNIIATTTNPEAVDKESLIYTLENSVPGIRSYPFSYLTEAYNEFNTEAELYLLGDQDLETTISNAKEKVQAVIDENQNNNNKRANYFFKK
ncbi:extracellular solute-binding protein [Oceanobacillus sp. 143]|nr:extracellular solute-binding protein [Oceanobacillus sp. 143]